MQLKRWHLEAPGKIELEAYWQLPDRCQNTGLPSVLKSISAKLLTTPDFYSDSWGGVSRTLPVAMLLQAGMLGLFRISCGARVPRGVLKSRPEREAKVQECEDPAWNSPALLPVPSARARARAALPLGSVQEWQMDPQCLGCLCITAVTSRRAMLGKDLFSAARCDPGGMLPSSLCMLCV